MTVTSFYFFVFLLVGLIIYYLTPKKIQWIVLLLMSIVFYVGAATPYTIIFLVISTLIAYGSTMYISKKADSTTAKAASTVAILGVIANIAIWFLLKGSSFWTLGSILVNRVFPDFPVLGTLPIMGALGMGYYTAQVIGYILDVSWGNAEAQKNPLKLFLFVGFFPQLTVGPISRYSDLKSLFVGHKFSYDNLCMGSQRILWGLFKKLVISDRIGIIVNAIWADTATYTGVWPWIAVFLYPLEMYADFSGCMDIVLGTAELFDIRLAENFKNPFFSRNSQEFWQRWHITLGNWARDYVFYPFMKCKWMVSLGRKCKKKFGKKWGKFITWSVSMAVLWFVMGFWHGAVKYIFGVSLWFWAVQFVGELMQPVSKKIIDICDFKIESFGWHFFQSIRTYAIYAFGAVFFSAISFREAINHLGVLLRCVKHLNPWTLFDGTIWNLGGITQRDINIIVLGILCLLVADILREKYNYARTWMKGQSFGFRWMIWIFLFIMVLVYGMYGPGYDASTFIYQGF